MAWQNSGSTGLFAEPTNGGQGFKAWSASRTADAIGNVTGYFLGTSTEYSGGNLNSDDNSCFGMYAIDTDNNPATTQTCNVVRELMSPLMIGGTLTFKLGIQYRNGFKGVVFKNGTKDLFAFRAGVLGGGDAYQTAAGNAGGALGTYTNLGWGYGTGDSVFTLAYNRTGTNSARCFIRQTGTSANNSTTINIDPGSDSTAIDRVEFYVANTQFGGGGQNNLYFNSLSAYNEWRLP